MAREAHPFDAFQSEIFRPSTIDFQRLWNAALDGDPISLEVVMVEIAAKHEVPLEALGLPYLRAISDRAVRTVPTDEG